MNSAKLKETIANIVKEESEYQVFFRKALEKAGKSITDMSDEEKKAFFNKIDAAWDGKGEKNEELVGNQHKLDVDGDGEIEASDLAALRAKKDESLTEEEIKWNAVENAIINFLKANTKILDKRVKDRDTEGVKGGLKSIISGLTNAQRNLKLESVVNEDTKKRFDVDFYKNSITSGTSHEEIIRGDKFSDVVSQATKVAKSKGMDYVEFYYKDAFIGSIAKKNNYTFKKGRHSDKSPLSVTEGVSPKDMDKIKGAVEAASSFMGIGSELKKTGLRYIFATSPMPVYIVQPTPNNKVAIVNKKYATKPDFVIGDTAVGVMESLKKVNEEIKVGQMVKVVNNPHWEAALGKKGPFKRKVKGIYGDSVFFTDGSNSDMKYIKEDAAVNEYSVNKKFGSKYDIGAGSMGNGTTFWNRAEEEFGDYKKIAHVSDNGVVKFYDKTLPSNVKKHIEDYAKTQKESVNEGIGTIALGVAGGLLLLKVLKFVLKKVVGAIGMNAPLPKEKLLQVVQTMVKTVIAQSSGKQIDMLQLVALQSFLKDEINAGKITTVKQIIQVIERATKIAKSKQESVNEEEIKWNAVENAIINFLKMNTKILDKRVKDRDTDGVKGGLSSIIRGLTNAQRNLKLESVNDVKEITANTSKLFNWFWDASPAKDIAKRVSQLNDKDLLSLYDAAEDLKRNGRLRNPRQIQLALLKKEIDRRGLSESVNELKKLPNGNFSIKKGYNTFADYEKNAKPGDTILKYDKRGGMIKTFVSGSELHQNAKKYLSKVHSIVGNKVNLSLFGKQGIATVPDYEKKEVGVLVLESINEGRAFINAARKAKAEGKTEFEFNGKKYPVTLKEGTLNEMNPQLNKGVKTLLDKELKDMRKGGSNHYFAVMNVLMGALTDANFHSESKKVPALFGSKAKYEGDPMGKKDMESLYQSIGERIATMAKWDGEDIAKAIGFYVSMTIGRPMGEKIEKLV